MGYIAMAVSLLILPALLLPVIGSVQQEGKMTGTLSNGRQIFIALFSQTLEGTVTGKDSTWPRASDFPTSTSLLTNLVGSGALKVDYSFFSAPGLTPYRGTNADLFKADNNAWCMVADLKDTDSDQTPFLFTRNLRVANLAELKGKVGALLSDELPFGGQGVAIVFKSGAAQKLRPDMLWSDVLGGATFTNRVLRP